VVARVALGLLLERPGLAQLRGELPVLGLAQATIEDVPVQSQPDVPVVGATGEARGVLDAVVGGQADRREVLEPALPVLDLRDVALEDRKSTRLNSSHVKISYAVFCLKKKKKSKRS